MIEVTGLHWDQPPNDPSIRRKGWTAPLGSGLLARSEDDLELTVDRQADFAVVTLRRKGSSHSLLELLARADEIEVSPHIVWVQVE